MRLFSLLFSLSCFFSLNSQSQPIPELPSISLEEAGFNRDSIQNLLDNVDQISGIVVVKDNQLVIEEYYNTFWRTSLHDIRSAGKSITSLLLGIAIKDGLIKNLEQDVYSFFSKEKYPSLHEDYKQVKLKHLLNMASGLNADSDDYNTPGHAGRWIGMDDWKDYILGIPLKRKPAKKFVYADINPFIISAIIEELTGISLMDYAEQKLFKPLNIRQYYWYSNVANQTGAAGNLYISTLDFAKLGVLVLNEGKWAGEQIIDANYMQQLLTVKETISEKSKLGLGA